MGGSAHLRNALTFVRLAEERTKPDAARKPGYQERDMPRMEGGQKQFVRQFDATLDRMFFKLALTKAAALPPAERPWLATMLGVKANAKIDAKLIDARLDALYKGTKLEDEATRLDLLKNATPKSLKASKDPYIKLALALWPTVKAKEAEGDQKAGDYLLVAPMYAKAMIEAELGAPVSELFSEFSEPVAAASIAQVHRARLADALRRDDAPRVATRRLAPQPYPYQQIILDRLRAERVERGHTRNLVVAATGTGKTVIAAFDYARQAPAAPPRQRSKSRAIRSRTARRSLTSTWTRGCWTPRRPWCAS